MGTINIFEAARKAESVRAILNMTTDRCYENREWVWGYREHEAMGGRDPYSSSKGCSELVTAAYRDSFFRDQGIAIASARAGNVIGGGDWATDRLIPDFLRALDSGIPLDVRYPNATRPWQHVLEPLSGYLLLAEQLMSQNPSADQAWNFGPADNDARPVSWILDYLISRAPVASWRHIGGQHLHEAGYLKLDSSRAHRELGWHPRWNLITALDSTLDWHFAWQDGQEMNNFCMEQIKTYSAD